jgi:DNA-binding XRE family transcriptional regulator
VGRPEKSCITQPEVIHEIERPSGTTSARALRVLRTHHPEIHAERHGKDTPRRLSGHYGGNGTPNFSDLWPVVAAKARADDVMATANQDMGLSATTIRVGSKPMPGATSAAAVGRRLKALRTKRGETPAQFAKAIGLSTPQVKALESGGKALASKQAENIAKALGVSARHLLVGEPSP